jgi:hypothetical protein
LMAELGFGWLRGSGGDATELLTMQRIWLRGTDDTDHDAVRLQPQT